MGDFDGFLPFDMPKMPVMSNKKKTAVAVIAITLLFALWLDFFEPRAATAAPCETDANCTPKNLSEIKVGVSYLCVNKTCVEKPFGNPASEKCEADGGIVRIEKDESGGERGICVLPAERGGAECDEWEYYRGECGSRNS